MLKVIFVYERQQSELFPKFLELLFESDKSFTGNGNEMLSYINAENPKLIFFDFENQPQSEKEVSKILSGLNPKLKLHISVIKISPANFLLFKFIRRKISRLFRKDSGGRGSGMKEAFAKK